MHIQLFAQEQSRRKVHGEGRKKRESRKYIYIKTLTIHKHAGGHKWALKWNSRRTCFQGAAQLRANEIWQGEVFFLFLALQVALSQKVLIKNQEFTTLAVFGYIFKFIF